MAQWYDIGIIGSRSGGSPGFNPRSDLCGLFLQSMALLRLLNFSSLSNMQDVNYM